MVLPLGTINLKYKNSKLQLEKDNKSNKFKHMKIMESKYLRDIRIIETTELEKKLLLTSKFCD